ncbi:MAG: putative metal-binding motif-containing protein [Myxococcaceae bacterium]|nr:putative metal-binding motif-containing protein [Myxococcaceae bacterium]
MALLLALTACYQAPPADGPYRCLADGDCGEGMVCDDGLCCVIGGTPACTTLVLDGGVCANGAAAKRYYLDKDGDGFGGANSERLACAQPRTVPDDAPNAQWIELGGDCLDDDPSAHPGAAETCDGIDNDCNGEVDDGLPRVDLYPDRDNDGYGDLAASPSPRCGPTPGMVADASDCKDNDATVHPGATEICNGIDDDCDGVKDESAPELGKRCFDSARVGACQRGKIACVDGALVCAQDATPAQERCNGVDDDCNGKTDEQPGCGGPVNLLTDPNVTTGVKIVDYPGGNLGAVTTCQKNRTSNAPTNDTFNGTTWSGVAGGTHVLWVETSMPYWDLRKEKLALHIQFTASAGGGFGGNMPIILLCGSASGEFIRYQPKAPGFMSGGTSISVDQHIPLVGTSVWSPLYPDTDLLNIVRVEILVQPVLSSSPPPAFSIKFQKLGFEVLP